ncbi:MAG TPA: hypothetical protein VHK63_00355 [Candidatus Limnocylindria bacterium]|nr:hypothetical protein [Candidatus Limnocylindria bacterium]
MTRSQPDASADLHQRFHDWLMGGSSGEPPRDVALHAAFCAECGHAMAAVDLLSLVDTGQAPMPPVNAEARGPRSISPAMRAGLAAAAGIVLGVAAWAAVPADLRPPGLVAPSSEQPTQGVLGGIGIGGVLLTPGPEATDEATAASADEPPSSTAAPPSSAPGIPGSVAPSVTPQVGSETRQPEVSEIPAPSFSRPPTARPTRSPSPRPSSAPPSPTQPTTPEPTPSPIVDDCEDGLDNDGDLLVDLADPGCLLDGNEPSA